MQLIELASRPDPEALVARIRERKQHTGSRLPAAAILRRPRRGPGMSLVADAGFVVAALVDGGTDGLCAQELLAGTDLAAPHLMPVEAADILRRAALAAGDISPMLPLNESCAA